MRGELGGPECVLWLQFVQPGASCVDVERRKRQLELRDSVVQARKSLRPLDPGTLYIVRKSTVQLPSLADSVTLLAFAAERRAAAAAAIGRYLLPAGRTAANPLQRHAVVDR